MPCRFPPPPPGAPLAGGPLERRRAPLARRRLRAVADARGVPLQRRDALDLERAARRYTFDHWIAAFGDARFTTVLARSIGLAVAVAVADVLLVAPAVYWQRVRNKAIRPVIETLAAIPFAMPLVVIAFGLLNVTGTFAPALQGTVAIVFAAHVAVAFSFVYWAIDGAMAAARSRP